MEHAESERGKAGDEDKDQINAKLKLTRQPWLGAHTMCPFADWKIVCGQMLPNIY